MRYSIRTLIPIVGLLATLLGSIAPLARAEPTITEFLASNVANLPDEDGDYPDWIELHNPDATPVSLNGWYLTDSAKKKTKWAIPAVTLPADGYLVIFASGKDRTDPTRPLHTNFSLDADGEYLALVRPDATVAIEFAPTFPPQHADISYGYTTPAPGDSPVLGYFATPTPGAANGGTDTLILPETISFSRAPGPFTGTISVALSGAGADEHIRYVLAAPSANGPVVAAPTTEAMEYTGPITISASTIVRAAAFSTDDKLHGLPATAQYVALNSNLASFSSQLPVLIFDNHGLGPITKDNLDHPAWLYAYEAPTTGAGFASAPEVGTPITMNVHGNFTAAFPKQSYNFTLQTDLGRDNSQPLLGLDDDADWCVVAPWSLDKSYIRDAYVYQLSASLGRWSPRTRFVEMFVNEGTDGLDASDYWGIGVLTDKLKIGPDRIDIASLAASDVSGSAVTGGYIIKFDPVPDPDHYSFTTSHGIPSADGTALVIESPSLSNLQPAQRDYIKGYVQEMEDALFADYAGNFATRTYRDYLDVDSFVDHHILELFVGNVDGLYRSEYFYKDRNGKLVSGPAWDFDTTMGNGDDRNANWDTWVTAGGIDLWNYGWFGPLTHDPEFMQQWVDRWQALRQDAFGNDHLNTLADELAAEVGPDAAARDAARWPDNASRFDGGYLGEVAHLKDWITHRAAWIDQQWVAVPTVENTGATLHLTPPAGAEIVYTLDGTDPRALGGDIAIGAIVSQGAVDVPATANLHARSYRPDLKGVFPGTPWSSAAAAANSTPIFPRARLINLSSRGFISGGENALIAGVVVTDTNAKHYLARGVGPALGMFGTGGTLPDPQLSVFRNGLEIYRNNGWPTAPNASALPAIAKSVGAFPLPAGSSDSALDTTLAADAYTLNITSPSGSSGVGLVELYDSDGLGRTVNLSTRAYVGAGANVLIGGFVVQGPAYKRVLIRGIGPTLTAFGVANALADPVITLYSGQTVVASNDRWNSAPDVTALRNATTAVGAFQLADSSEDAAMLITVPPGAYTVIVEGKNAGEGVGLLEIYDVP